MVSNILTEEFLYELYSSAMSSDKVGVAVSTHIRAEYLPNRYWQKIHSAFHQQWSEFKENPTYGILSQVLASEKRCLSMLDTIRDSKTNSVEVTLQLLEDFIKGVRQKKAIESCVKYYNDGKIDLASSTFSEHAEWESKFTLKPSKLINVFDTFADRYKRNKEKVLDQNANQKSVSRLYIDEIDRVNDNRSLRGQLTVILAGSGVGKTHYARHYGLSASLLDGLDVLQLQMEGTADEVANAYSGAIAKVNSSVFEQGELTDEEYAAALQTIQDASGSLYVKSYSKFGESISTMDVKNSIDEFFDVVGKYPDAIIVDSMDLLTDYRKTKKVREELRHIRLNVAEDLKNIAMDFDCHVVATYQATIESQDKISDENFVLTRDNSSEAKGIIRPITIFLTMNQTPIEKEERSMRFYVDKARFFDNVACGNRGVVKIKTNYDKGMFYDREATLRLVGTA